MREPALRWISHLLKSKLVDAIQAAHLRHVESQRVSGQAGQSHYGLIWKSLPVDCVNAIQEQWANAGKVQPGRAGYHLPVLQDTVIFPWRPRGGGDPRSTLFITSPSRGGLWTLTPHAQGMLELGGFDVAAPDSDPEPELHEVVEFAEVEHLRVVIVAVESDMSRLRKITWGVVKPEIDGTLHFADPEVLYLADDLSVTPDSKASTARAAIEQHTFASGLAPQPIVRKRETGTGDE